MQASPLTIAREALHQLALNRLPPTPDHYARAYQAIAAPTTPFDLYGAATLLREFADEMERNGRRRADAAALRAAVDAFDWQQARQALQRVCDAAKEEPGTPAAGWSALIQDLLAQWEARAGDVTKARKRDSLERVLSTAAPSPDQLHTRLRALIRSWHDAALAAAQTAPIALIDAAHRAQTAPPAGADAAAATVAGAQPAPGENLPAPADDAVLAWRELLAQTLCTGVVERLGYSPELAREAASLAADVRSARTPVEIAALVKRLQQLFLTLEHDTENHLEVQQGLLRLLRLLALNLTELVGSDTWLRGQLNAVTALAQGPIDCETIASLERTLRDITLKQGVLKHSLDQAKAALRDMVATFVDRLATLAEDTGGYHDRLTGYASRIQQADDLASLSGVVHEVMNDTRGLQSDLARTREELIASRQRVDEYQNQIRKLEDGMATLSDRVHEDELTQLLNRRGLARAFEAEAARAERHGRPLCLALLDVDDFKQLNDRLGHAAGDNALVHLARIVRRSLRPTDVICRYGGEEFVVLLPETELVDAAGVMTRAQRQLTKHIFLDHNERVLITFSAGVAQQQPGEDREALIARADTALYRAKEAGKNRVAAA